MKNNGNIVLHQLQEDGSLFTIKELLPEYTYSENAAVLVKQGDTSIFWKELDLSINIVEGGHIKDTSIYYDKGRVGLGRSPLFSYNLDIAVPKNSTVTALHIGDGSYGFSLGNGTQQGFIPEIIGVGSDETDAGLYFIGIAGNDISSNTPLIIFDGRNRYSTKLNNRPILGITSGDYSDYCVTVDSDNNLNVKGNIAASDIIINNTSLLSVIKDLQQQIEELKQNQHET